MREYYDRIVFWACITVLAIMSFAGGLITTAGIIYCIWRFVL